MSATVADITSDPGRGTPRTGEPLHRSTEQHARPNLRRSLFALATSVVPFVLLWALMYAALDVSYFLVLLLAIPTAGFVLRTYILFHDCVHGSFLNGRRANSRLGAVLALMVFTPFARWQHEHIVHHGTSGDLDRRGIGDVPMITLAEYNQRSARAKLGYRLFRHPLVMFGIGPFYAMVVQPRFISRSAPKTIRRSVWGTNLALALAIGGLCLLIGWRAFVLVQLPLVPLAGGTGIWLFYVQHQFEGTYWERTDDWSYEAAAVRGSSYLRLPKLFQFFTANIGLHHVHHLNHKIPNYNLQRAHDETPVLHSVAPVSFWDGLRATRLKLWDEDAGRMVSWPKRTPNPASA